MSGSVKVLFLLFAGLALGMGYNVWPIAAQSGLPIIAEVAPNAIDLKSYAIGLFVGMVLWQTVQVPWFELPGRFQKFLLAQVHVYQFVILGGACFAVLVYF